jgi:hypothetical protein
MPARRTAFSKPPTAAMPGRLPTLVWRIPASISVDPLSPNTVYACQSLNLYKSTDGAKTWKSIRAAGCAVVAADPKTEGIVWQGFGFDFPIVTLDGGGTFFGTYGKVVTNAIAIPRGIGK